jgi:hypothetical protein
MKNNELFTIVPASFSGMFLQVSANPDFVMVACSGAVAGVSGWLAKYLISLLLKNIKTFFKKRQKSDFPIMLNNLHHENTSENSKNNSC